MQQKIRRALLSVSDKTGLEGFARNLSQMGVELLSTGGTHRVLAEAGIPVTEVAEYTGFPEMMSDPKDLQYEESNRINFLNY